uniref:Uncharacterized protein n=1 Tax=Arundo donax TaxID=35708 RepID=A0A0A9FIU4_ARUDO
MEVNMLESKEEANLSIILEGDQRLILLNISWSHQLE